MIETKQVKITPQRATEWLNKYNTHNRPLSNATVERYASDIRAGNWKLNGEPIIFGKTRLLDGQHRLYACVEAGVAFTSLVAEGVSDDAFDTIDVGKMRSSGDVLSIAGHSKHANTLGAAALLCIQYRQKKLRSNQAIPRHEVLQFVESNPELLEWVARAREAKGWVKSYAATTAAVMYLASVGQRVRAESFLEKFSTGENLTKTSPVLALRNRVATEKRMPKLDRFILFVRAWNAYARDQNLSKIQLPRIDADHDLPRIVGSRY